jgi:uncharacterized protein
MQCPVDQTELVMAERQGIEIDYCPKCRGVWLDRGELDKIIDRATPGPAASAPIAHQPHPSPHDDRYYRRKRKSLLGELFDF